MEAVSFVAGEAWSDHPKCASGVIGAFLRSWNDSLSDTDRQMLKPYVLRLVGSAAPKEVEVARARLAQDWMIRVFTPAWLELAGLHDHAETLRSLNEIVSSADLVKAQPKLDAARTASAAARAAAGAAARAAARDAAWDAARAAARDAARAAARAAARDAAWDAAWAAARAAAGDAAGEKAAEALEPTVKRLQRSALDLLDRMLALQPKPKRKAAKKRKAKGARA